MGDDKHLINDISGQEKFNKELQFLEQQLQPLQMRAPLKPQKLNHEKNWNVMRRIK
jgi:hypothetical protein